MTMGRIKVAQFGMAGLVAAILVSSGIDILVSSGIDVRVSAQVSSGRVAEPDARGLHLTAEVPLGALAPQSMYWHIYEFDSHEAAEAARPARGAVAEAFGRHWLYVIADEGWRPAGGRKCPSSVRSS
jgi:hypothetical protein